MDALVAMARQQHKMNAPIAREFESSRVRNRDAMPARTMPVENTYNTTEHYEKQLEKLIEISNYHRSFFYSMAAIPPSCRPQSALLPVRFIHCALNFRSILFCCHFFPFNSHLFLSFSVFFRSLLCVCASVCMYVCVRVFAYECM